MAWGHIRLCDLTPDHPLLVYKVVTSGRWSSATAPRFDDGGGRPSIAHGRHWGAGPLGPHAVATQTLGHRQDMTHVPGWTFSVCWGAPGGMGGAGGEAQ